MEDTPNDETPKRDWKRLRPSFDRRKISKRLKRAEKATTKHAHRFILKRLDSLRASRQHIIAWLVLVSAVIAVVGMQLGVSSHQYTVEAPVGGGTYAEGVVGKLDTLNPLYASTSPEVAASRLLFSSLFDYDTTGHLRPSVARALTMSEDRRTYTVTMRQDVTWHDGAQLTADDVLFTIETIKNPAARVRSSLAANWQSVEVRATDKYTLQFTLPAYAAFPHALTFPIVPKHILARVAPSALQESNFSRAPVGSGPFSYRLLQSADGVLAHKAVHLSANSAYFGGAPRLARFELHAYPDRAALVNALNAHEVIAGVDASLGKAAIQGSGYTLDEYPIANGVYALMNTSRSFLRDQQVRSAFQLAVDVRKVRAAAGEALPALDLPFIANQVEGATSVEIPQPDLAKAAALLDKAGWKLAGNVRVKDGQEMTLSITVPANERYERAANELASQLSGLHIKTSVTVVDVTAPRSNFIQEVLQPRNYDMLVYELPIGADPDVYAYWHSSQLGMSGYNFADYRNGISDTALVSARDRSDQRLRDPKYLIFARQWLRDAPAIGLFQQTVSYAYSANTTNLVQGTQLISAPDRYANITSWTVNRARLYKTP